VSTIQIITERIGHRTYLRGNTYGVKDLIKAAGGHWDGDEKAWWFGSDERAQEIAAKCATTTPKATAGWTKLADGTWGLRGQNMTPGGKVTVSKRDGAREEHVVASILSNDAQGWQVATIQKQASSSSRRPSGGFRGNYRGNGGNRAPGGRRCPECGSSSCSKAWNYRDLCDED
jgi:hypothetical protein